MYIGGKPGGQEGKAARQGLGPDPVMLVEQSLTYIRAVVEGSQRSQNNPAAVKKAAVEGLLELAVLLELGLSEETSFTVNRSDVREPIGGLHAMRHLLKDVMGKTWRVVEFGFGRIDIYVQDHWLKSAAIATDELPASENTLKTYLANQANKRTRPQGSGIDKPGP